MDNLPFTSPDTVGDLKDEYLSSEQALASADAKLCNLRKQVYGKRIDQQMSRDLDLARKAYQDALAHTREVCIRLADVLHEMIHFPN